MADVTNYIDRLVAELCPDGVDFYTIDELITLDFGTRITKSKDAGAIYPVYGGGGASFRTDNYNREDKYVVSRFAMSEKCVRYVSGKFWMLDSGFTYSVKDESLLSYKYISYWLLNAQQEIYACSSQSAQRNLKTAEFKRFEVPVPPLEIQEAIVEILDKFTNLEAELEAELEARTLQYEYYRDSLFEALDCPRVPLGSLGIRNKGITITASKMRTLEPGNKDVRIFAAGSTFIDTDSSFIPDKGILEGPAIIVKSRGYIGFEYYEGKFTHKNELWSYSLTSDLVEQKFIYYYLLTQAYHLHELARGKSVKLPQLAVKDTDELLVPVPSLEEQQRIVDILDRFDALTSSLSEGLPAELAARRSQYEYYRDQLLTFPRKGENQ